MMGWIAAWRRLLLTGLLVVLPVSVTIWAVRLVLTVLDGVVAWLPAFIRPQAFLGMTIPGDGLLVIVVILTVVGLFATNVLGKYVVSMSEALLARIPLVRTIYLGVKQTLEILFYSKQSFQNVVLVEYPRKGVWSLAFVTNESVQGAGFDDAMVALFVPTTPNPTSGYILLVPKSDIRYLDMNADQALKFVISLGAINTLPTATNAPRSPHTTSE